MSLGENTLKLVECTGAPFEMGYQYGEQAREEIQRYLELQRQHLNTACIDNFARNVKQILQSFLPDVLEELKGIAEGSQADLNEILSVNYVDTFGDNPERCTPIILRNSSDGTIVAKNNDAPMQEENPFIIRKCVPKQGIPFIQVTYAGWLSGLDMINAEGLANTHGSVGSVFDKTGKRVDIRLSAYNVMQNCKTTEEFIQNINRFPLTGKGFNIAVGDSNGQTAMLDAAVPFIAIRNRNKQFDYATNIYMSIGLENADMRLPAKREICIYRYGYLRWIEQTNPPKSLDDIKKLLMSHEPWAPCRHGGAHDSKTVWSMICLTEQRKILVSHGSPCQNKYQEYHL